MNRTDRARPSRSLRLAGVVAVLWALLPPFTPPELQTTLAAEIIDHVVPAVVVAFVLAWSWDGADRFALFNRGLAMTVAGLFMVGTHIPLIAQALRGEVGWAPAIHHSLAPLAVIVYGAIWTWQFR